MSLSVAAITKLVAENHFSAEPNLSGVCRLRLTGDKSYLVTKVLDDNYIVERKYESVSCCDGVRTAAAKLFNRTNRQKINSALTSEPSLWRGKDCKGPFSPVLKPNVPQIAIHTLAGHYESTVFIGSELRYIKRNLSANEGMSLVAGKNKPAEATDRFGANRFCFVEQGLSTQKDQVSIILVHDLYNLISPCYMSSNTVVSAESLKGSNKVLVDCVASYVKLRALDSNTFNVHRLDKLR